MKQMRYIPALNPYTGSINATLLMAQLEYWFQKTAGETFYKFTEPCQDPSYQIGDSWCEELGFSKAEFRSAFAKIGKVYKSKKAYQESTDKFEGKLYLSYYDRIKHLTYYIRNDAAVAAITTEIHIHTLGEAAYQQQPSPHTATHTLPSTPIQTSREPLSALPLSVDYTHTLPSKEEESLTHTDVIQMYHTTCPTLPPIETLTPTLRDQLTQLIHRLAGKRQALQHLFDKVAASDFLSGRILGKAWRATLQWITKGEKYKDILADKYQNRLAKRASKQQTKASRFHKIASHNWDFDQLEALEQQYIAEKLEKNKNSTNPLLSRLPSFGHQLF